MSQYTLLRGARQLLTLRGPDGVRSGPALQNLGVIADGSVLVRDGLIAEIGPTRRIENLKEARTAVEFDMHNSVVMPGLVDPSLRVALNGSGEGPVRRPKRIGQLYDETLMLLRSCLQNGTTAVELKGTAAQGDYHSDLGVLRRLAKIGDQPVGMVRTWQLARVPQSAAEVTDFCDTLERLSRKQLIHFVEAKLTEGVSLTADFVQGLKRNQIGLKLHWPGGTLSALRETLSQVRPFSMFAASPLTAEQATLLKQHGVTVVFAPANESGDRGPLGARHAIDAGLGVALSSGYDGVAHPAYSMLMALSLAHRYGALTVEEAITAATVNAAHAVGCGESRGALTVGRRADIIVLNVSDYRDITRQFGINNVSMVLRDGVAALNRRTWKMGA